MTPEQHHDLLTAEKTLHAHIYACALLVSTEADPKHIEHVTETLFHDVDDYLGIAADITKDGTNTVDQSVQILHTLKPLLRALDCATTIMPALVNDDTDGVVAQLYTMRAYIDCQLAAFGAHPDETRQSRATA